MFRILVVEDDADQNELYCAVLKENGFETCSAANGKEALELMDHSYVDLVISDIMMPEMDGYELTRAIREADMTLPVLMITAKDTMFYKQEGFQAGTDDYMVKPVDVNEMVWRVKALLRRSQASHEKKLTVGETTLHLNDNTVETAAGAEILPPKEFQLLFKLLSTPSHTFSRMQLMDEIWGMDAETDAHTLEVHVGRLRERFKNSRDFEIKTVRGIGYKAVTL